MSIWVAGAQVLGLSFAAPRPISSELDQKQNTWKSKLCSISGVSAPQWLLDFIVVHIHPQKPFKNLDLLEEFMFVKCNLHITASFCISISSNVFLLHGPKVGVRAEITKIKTRSCFQGGSWTWQLRNHLGHPHIQYYNA